MIAAARFYAGKVFHARLRPVQHRFTYRALSLVVDIDRLAEANRLSPLFSIDRFNLLSFHQRDHGLCDGSSLRGFVETLLQKAELTQPAERILLQSFPRIAGLGFSPLSIYFVMSSDKLSALVYSVRNTFGERHNYVFGADAPESGRCFPHEADKAFYVSPFMEMPLRYRFATDLPDESIHVRIVERDLEGPLLTAIATGRAIAPGKSAPGVLRLLREVLAFPLLGASVIAGIHWQALKLWFKGMRLQPRAPHQRTMSFDEPGAFSILSRSRKST